MKNKRIERIERMKRKKLSNERERVEGSELIASKNSRRLRCRCHCDRKVNDDRVGFQDDFG